MLIYLTQKAAISGSSSLPELSVKFLNHSTPIKINIVKRINSIIVWEGGAKSYLGFTNTRGPANTQIQIPLMDKHDTGRRSHYLTVQFSIHDAPLYERISFLSDSEKSPSGPTTIQVGLLLSFFKSNLLLFEILFKVVKFKT